MVAVIYSRLVNACDEKGGSTILTRNTHTPATIRAERAKDSEWGLSLDLFAVEINLNLRLNAEIQLIQSRP